MTKKAVSKGAIWAPMIFCAGIALVRMLWDDSEDPALPTFLMLCFLWVATVHLSLWKRIEALEIQLSGRSQETREG